MANAALGDSGTLHGLPALYAIDLLAQRWGIAPWQITAVPEGVDPDEHVAWLLRGMEFQRMEASVKRGS